MNNVSGRTALITGASRGLGLELAKALAKKHWALIINARAEEALAVAQEELCRETSVISIAGDVASPATREALAQAAHVAGGIDLLANNASILGPSPMPGLLAYSIQDLEAVYQVNVFAPLALIQALQNAIKPNGCILNVTSDAAVDAYGGWGGYGSSKAALEQISAVLAVEQLSWRVLWVDPGDMQTQMHQDAFPGEDISDRPLPALKVPKLLELIEGNLPSGRYSAA